MVLWSRKARTIIAIVDSTIGRELRRGAPEKEPEVYRLNGRLQREYIAFCRGRVQRFPSTISIEAVSDGGNDIIITENSSTTIGRSNREGIMLGMEQTRGAELEAWNQPRV